MRPPSTKPGPSISASIACWAAFARARPGSAACRAKRSVVRARALVVSAALMVGEVRAGKGPRFLHATTCRWRGHLALDRGLYRDPAEVAGYAARDPLVATARLLLDNGVAQSTLDEDARSASERIAAAAAIAEAAPSPDPGELFTDVQDTGAPSWP